MLFSKHNLLAVYLSICSIAASESNCRVLDGQSFGFVPDLSKPDGLLFGINLLPIVMTLINFTATFAAPDMRPKERTQAVVVALLFLLLLYTAPSALLIYWTGNNILYLLENLKILKKPCHSL